MKKFEIRRNEQANGIEIYFSCKPSESVRDALKGAGRRNQNDKERDEAGKPVESLQRCRSSRIRNRQRSEKAADAGRKKLR